MGRSSFKSQPLLVYRKFSKALNHSGATVNGGAIGEYLPHPEGMNATLC